MDSSNEVQNRLHKQLLMLKPINGLMHIIKIQFWKGRCNSNKKRASEVTRCLIHWSITKESYVCAWSKAVSKPLSISRFRHARSDLWSNPCYSSSLHSSYNNDLSLYQHNSVKSSSQPAAATLEDVQQMMPELVQSLLQVHIHLNV